MVCKQHNNYYSYYQAEIVDMSEEEREEEEHEEDMSDEMPDIPPVRPEVRTSHRLAESDSESEGEVDESELASRRLNLRQRALQKIQQEEEVSLTCQYYFMK